MWREYSRQQERIDQLQKQLFERDDERTLREECDTVQAAMAELTRERDESRNRVTEQEGKITTSYQNLGALGKEAQTAHGSNSQSEETIRNLQQQLDDTTRRFQEQVDLTQYIKKQHEQCDLAKQRLE